MAPRATAETPYPCSIKGERFRALIPIVTIASLFH
jgi:hypothetical protein